MTCMRGSASGFTLHPDTEVHLQEAASVALLNTDERPISIGRMIDAIKPDMMAQSLFVHIRHRHLAVPRLCLAMKRPACNERKKAAD